ncbi:MAG: arginine--tRNA ligase [Bacteroidales bacterium]|nr:arginine--tRNA ligase [Bacteroidales bacterium]MDZ4204793.1 arginine--tRNA ligase [Bacteroidales bacterium]
MIYDYLRSATLQFAQDQYGVHLSPDLLQVQKTRKEFSGDFTIVMFAISKIAKKSPETCAGELGQWLREHYGNIVGSFNVIKGFLNIEIVSGFWIDFFVAAADQDYFRIKPTESQKPVLIEFSSPNTNKPLHLGHIRNNLLGHSLAEILKASGKQVVKLNLVNDRGIHICKSMLAWQRWGNGETPESSDTKGDHLVGKYYVLFDQHFKEELRQLSGSGSNEEDAEAKSALMADVREMLRRWENGDSEIRRLWEMMNTWVYEGFDETYARIGISFDHTDYESDTYLLGKDIVLEGVQQGKLIRKDDGSVWADLKPINLDEKLLLRSDGTSVYMTQDIGTACSRHERYEPQLMIYVVGNEQNYHFDVLKKVLDQLGFAWSDKLLHLSYGMVELPQGRMKSREGTVVDADDLMEEMYETARKTTMELGKIDEFEPDELNKLFHMLGMGALKYFILRVDPRKTMLFNPQESIDFNGNTGPFIQYTHARIRSVWRKAIESGWKTGSMAELIYLQPEKLPAKEKELLRILYEFPMVVKEAGDGLSPATVANYAYELAKEYNQFYHEFSVLHEKDVTLARFRLALSVLTGRVIKSAMQLLGIEVPERM